MVSTCADPQPQYGRGGGERGGKICSKAARRRRGRPAHLADRIQEAGLVGDVLRRRVVEVGGPAHLENAAWYHSHNRLRGVARECQCQQRNRLTAMPGLSSSARAPRMAADRWPRLLPSPSRTRCIAAMHAVHLRPPAAVPSQHNRHGGHTSARGGEEGVPAGEDPAGRPRRHLMTLSVQIYRPWNITRKLV